VNRLVLATENGGEGAGLEWKETRRVRCQVNESTPKEDKRTSTVDRISLIEMEKDQNCEARDVTRTTRGTLFV
jgi:hypothetical protein